MRDLVASRKYAQVMVAVLLLSLAIVVGARIWGSSSSDSKEGRLTGVDSSSSAQVSQAQLKAWSAALSAKAPAGRGALADTVGSRALVLYDSSGEYGFLGELYAMMTANLAGRFGKVKAIPLSDYRAGELDRYTAVFYAGSSYNSPMPESFLRDVAATAKPVMWMNYNIEKLAASMGTTEFSTRYGWNPAGSERIAEGRVVTVKYKNRELARNVPTEGDEGVLKPQVTDATTAKTLAQAVDSETGEAFPWAVRAGNLTYLSEIPYSYAVEGDRTIVLADLMFDALAPQTAERHRALLRIEDVHARNDPAKLRAIAEYLYDKRIPYAFEIIPVYADPLGVNNGGTRQRLLLTDRPELLAVLKYMAGHGGVPVIHGHTHQYKSARNPYDGISGPDFEFYRAHIADDNSVVLDGPVAEDSKAWALGRVKAAKRDAAKTGLPTPRLWTTPHYTASADDQEVFRDQFAARYDRPMLFPGYLLGRKLSTSKAVGQFLPYPVNDVYGGAVVPENLGNYIPAAYNNNATRLPKAMIQAAEANLAVRDGFASFFYHGYHDVTPLQQTVEGIQKLGYTFVSPLTLLK